MMSAPITPGTHPRRVRRKTIITEPQPRSITANGGKITANRTCKQDMVSQIFCKVSKKNDVRKEFRLFFTCRKMKKIDNNVLKLVYSKFLL